MYNNDLTASDDLKFKFTKSGTKYGYEDTNGNFIPFKDGAVLIGTYSSDTSINVSAYNPTSASQFLLVPTSKSEISTSPGNSYNTPQVWGFASMIDGSLSLSENTLTISLPTLKVRAGFGDGADYLWKTSQNTASIPSKVYYIGWFSI